ncbi:alpha/beta fold hydrolase [uncultured Amaricoccus sp.]|uniref:alpha/beta fold hydrolase n=1 Tax=uncultured Amaricoccus sp. TaxID=339341 RepID=UPI00260AFBC2|nr:alpha/beta fold hydrolase [uncultured Amaricoccus sp.]
MIAEAVAEIVARTPAAHRIGEPSPLSFHLASALAAYGQALLAAPRANSPSFPWSSEERRAAAALGPDLDQMEVAAEIAARLTGMIRGLEMWQCHPYRRAVVEPPTILGLGCSRLLDYGAAPEAAAPDGPPVLMVPSLINRAYILDLEPGRSMLRWLAARGARPFLLDWGPPGRLELGFDLQAYGARLLAALDHVRALTGRSVSVMGYCMGGTLATGLAACRPEGIASLVAIGTPWDFASTEGMAGGFRAIFRALGAAKSERMLTALGDIFGAAPVFLFQALFGAVNPLQAAVKFQKFARLDPESPEATHFVALEDWLADGIPMPVGAAKDLLIGWQIRNETAAGRWRFLGDRVDPRAIGVPALIVCARNDTIASPPLTEPLAELIPRGHLIRPATGHVGMVVGGGAADRVWRPIAEFLASHAR